jgi:integrase
MKGIRRTVGVTQRRVRPLVVEDVRKVVTALPDTLSGQRDCALILPGFAAALRRSELVALNVEDVDFVDGRLHFTIRRSKTDQEGCWTTGRCCCRLYNRHLPCAGREGMAQRRSDHVWLRVPSYRPAWHLRVSQGNESVQIRVDSSRHQRTTWYPLGLSARAARSARPILLHTEKRRLPRFGPPGRLEDTTCH